MYIGVYMCMLIKWFLILICVSYTALMLRYFLRVDIVHCKINRKATKEHAAINKSLYEGTFGATSKN